MSFGSEVTAPTILLPPTYALQQQQQDQLQQQRDHLEHLEQQLEWERQQQDQGHQHDHHSLDWEQQQQQKQQQQLQDLQEELERQQQRMQWDQQPLSPTSNQQPLSPSVQGTDSGKRPLPVRRTLTCMTNGNESTFSQAPAQTDGAVTMSEPISPPTITTIPAPSVPVAGLATVCTCGSVFMDDAEFCRKCGQIRQQVFGGATLVTPGRGVMGADLNCDGISDYNQAPPLPAGTILQPTERELERCRNQLLMLANRFGSRVESVGSGFVGQPQVVQKPLSTHVVTRPKIEESVRVEPAVHHHHHHEHSPAQNYDYEEEKVCHSEAQENMHWILNGKKAHICVHCRKDLVATPVPEDVRHLGWISSFESFAPPGENPLWSIGSVMFNLIPGVSCFRCREPELPELPKIPDVHLRDVHLPNASGLELQWDDAMGIPHSHKPRGLCDICRQPFDEATVVTKSHHHKLKIEAPHIGAPKLPHMPHMPHVHAPKLPHVHAPKIHMPHVHVPTAVSNSVKHIEADFPTVRAVPTNAVPLQTKTLAQLPRTIVRRVCEVGPLKPDVDLSKCSCGNVFMDDSVFCRKCGERRPQVCTCGNVFASDSNFCRKCGASRPQESQSQQRQDFHQLHQQKLLQQRQQQQEQLFFEQQQQEQHQQWQPQ
eukprot:TRINITY_DN12901_c2_g1_i9.p1 TRINITY_DN12901_c2_g1~~TRINITY_DN12901_c2_g1_i9.p1  ORF type:complete len:655 (-),score=158.19 TRINITY_DN12901_c2_g1_i9:1429-3393(-)